MPFKYDVIFSDRLSDEFRLDVWYCLSCSDSRAICFNIELVDKDGNELGMSQGDGQWYETKAACEAAGRLYFLMKYQDNPFD